jgi:hypothetical protein
VLEFWLEQAHGGGELVANWRRVMVSYRFTVAWAAVFVTTCFGQDGGGLDPGVALPPIREVLSRAQVSGSLAYLGRCNFHPDFPQFRLPPSYSGSPREILQEMFAGNPKMRVTQEPDGKVRMAERDVPTDLLDVKISHISFAPNEPVTNMLSGSDMLHGPNVAVQAILQTPEVKAFRKAHNIGPFSATFETPGDAGSTEKPIVSGDLDNVTVSQALDYVLQTFPGFWLYENCRSEGGGRQVFLGIFENVPPKAYNISTKKKQ